MTTIAKTKGLYSKQTIQKGEKICMYDGEIITTPPDDSEYVVFDGKHYINPVNMPECLGRYANDGGRLNNALFVNVCTPSLTHWIKHGKLTKSVTYFIATKTILPDEEILVNYGYHYWKDRTHLLHPDIRASMEIHCYGLGISILFVINAKWINYHHGLFSKSFIKKKPAIPL